MKSRYERLSSIALKLQLEKYIRDAARLALGVPFYELSCYLDSIYTAKELSQAITDCGEEYIKKMSALRNAAPVVRGDTISIFQPKEVAPNAPSIEDHAFLTQCLKQLRERGFVLAADADTYEKIAKAYPGAVFPTRVRGSEARRYLELRDPQIVAKAIKKRGRRS